MAKIWMSGGGEGADLDAITAKAEDTLKPKIYINEYGDPAEGTMPDKRIVDPTIGSINSGYPNVAIHKVENVGSIQMSDTTVSKEKLLAIPPPPGYYYQNYVGAPLDKVASVTGVTKEKILYNQTACGITGTATNDANAVAADIRTGTSAYARGVKVPGSMPDYGKTPTQINNVRINNGRFEVAVAAGYHGEYWAAGGYEYMSYDQVANAIGLTPAKLKKGEVVCGRTGTFEGWVPTPTDYYLRGNNIKGITISDGQQVTFETGGIRTENTSQSTQVYKKPVLKFPSVNLTPYNYLNVTFRYESKKWYYNGERNMRMRANIRKVGSYTSDSLATAYSSGLPINTDYTISIPISTLAYTFEILLDIGIVGEYYDTGTDDRPGAWDVFGMNTWTGWIYRLWFS